MENEVKKKKYFFKSWNKHEQILRSDEAPGVGYCVFLSALVLVCSYFSRCMLLNDGVSNEASEGRGMQDGDSVAVQKPQLGGAVRQAVDQALTGTLLGVTEGINSM